MPLSIVSYWPLEGSSGADARLGNTLTASNVGSAAGKLGNAADFNGTTSSFSISNHASLQVGDFDFTIGGWLFLDASASNLGVMQKENNDSANAGYRLDLFAGQIRWFLFNAGVAGNMVANVSNSTWYHVLAWWDTGANVMGLSLNNSPNTTSASPPIHAADPIRLGLLHNHGFLDGLMDEWFFALGVPTATERAKLYNGGAGYRPWLINPGMNGGFSDRFSGGLAA